MGETLESAFDNLFTHSVSNSELNNESLIYITTMIDQSTSLCIVMWNQNEELLRKCQELALKNTETLKELLRLCSGSIRRGRDVLRDLSLDPTELLKAYEEGDLEKNVQDWYVTFMSFIAATEKFADAEGWVRHKANHIHSTDGGGGVAILEHKVKLYMTLTFVAMDMQIFDRLHNSGGDSKCQLSEQTVSGCARLTSYDCDQSATDGVACSVASPADLAGTQR